MKKWEYKYISIKKLNETEGLNNEGEDGWELITILPSDTYGYKCIFKREVNNETKQINLND